MTVKRPLLVTFLVLSVLMVAGIYLVQLVQAIRLWDFNRQLPLSVSPVYLVITGFIFCSLGLVTAWGLWRGWRRGREMAGFYAAAVAAQYWLDRYFLSSSDARRVNSTFVILATIFFLVMVFWILALPETRHYFQAQSSLTVEAEALD